MLPSDTAKGKGCSLKLDEYTNSRQVKPFLVTRKDIKGK
jgi:hypothetical protein